MDKLLMLGSCKGGKEILDEARRRDIYTIIADNCEGVKVSSTGR